MLFYIGLGEEGKQLLEEFSDTPHAAPDATADSEPGTENEQPWETLVEGGVAQGFIDDIRELLDGR